MKILHILSQRPEQTGSGVYITQLIRQAHSAGHENAMLAGVPSSYCHSQDGTCCSTYFVRFGDDLPHDVAGMSDVMPYPSVRFRDFSDAQLDAYETCFAGRMREAVTDFGPDILHVNHLWFAASLARRLFPNIPIVASCHGSDLRQFQSNPHLRSRVLAGCSQLDAVCALHRVQKEDICRLYGISADRVHITGVGYDDDLFSCALKPSPPPVRICYAGKLSAAKGVPWLLRAFDRMGQNVHLDLCGSGVGTERDEIVAYASRLAPRVVMHGNLDHSAMARVMQRSHIFVLPSLYEGLPLVMLEALACGCRLVGTRLPGIEEAFGDLPESVLRLVDLPRLQGQDTLFQEDEELFVAALGDALSCMVVTCIHDGYAPASTAIDSVLGRYTWKAVFARVQVIYNSLYESILSIGTKCV